MSERTYTPRKEFNSRQRAEIMERDKGACQACGELVGGGRPYAYDHIVPVWCGGKTVVSNGQLLCEDPCHKNKTREDNRLAKKGARIRGETGQRARRERKGSSLKSRGFEKADGPSPLSKKHPNYRNRGFQKRGSAAH